MNNLHNVIRVLGVHLDTNNIINILDTDVILSVDNNLYTIAQIKLIVSNLDALRLVCGTIKAASDADPLVWAFSQKLFTTGIAFSDPETQGIITTLAAMGGWSDQVRDAILGIGIKRGKEWQRYGLSKLPNKSEVEEAKIRIEEVNKISEVISNFTSFHHMVGTVVGANVNDILNPAIDKGKTIDDIKGDIDISKIDELISILESIKMLVK